LNRYTVRPLELTRIDPRLLFETPTVAEPPLEAFGDAAVAAPPPPQAATDRAMSGITAAVARKLRGLLRVMWFLRLGISTVAASGGVRITHRVVRKPEKLVVTA
jgi:hypothetical protein